MHYTNPVAPVEGPEESPPLEVALLTWEYPPIPTAKGRVACEVAHGLARHGLINCASVCPSPPRRPKSIKRDDTLMTFDKNRPRVTITNGP